MSKKNAAKKATKKAESKEAEKEIKKVKKSEKKPAAKKAKKAVPKLKEEVKEVQGTKKPPKYYEAVGRRKTAVARVRFWTQGEKVFLINEKPYQDYFPTLELQQIITSSLRKMNCLERFRVLAKVKGGGLHAQAEAVRHGTARALILFSPDFKKRLKKAGYLTRDARMRERKKFGLKRARRAPQWQKR